MILYLRFSDRGAMPLNGRRGRKMAEAIKDFICHWVVLPNRSLFDMTPGVNRSDEVSLYAFDKNPLNADAEALYGDWCAVGKDIMSAAGKVGA